MNLGTWLPKKIDPIQNLPQGHIITNLEWNTAINSVAIQGNNNTDAIVELIKSAADYSAFKSTISKRVQICQTDITTLQQSVATLTATLTTTNNAVSALTTRITTCETDISALAQSLANLSTTVTGHTSAISTVNTRVTQLSTDVAAAIAALTADEVAYDNTQTGTTGTVQNAIKTLNGTVTTHLNSTTKHIPQTDNLNAGLAFVLTAKDKNPASWVTRVGGATFQNTPNENTLATEKAVKAIIPTKTSDLINDSNFVSQTSQFIKDMPNGFWQKVSGGVVQCKPVSENLLETEVTISDVDRSTVSPGNVITIPSYNSLNITRCGSNLFNPNGVATGTYDVFEVNADGSIRYANTSGQSRSKIFTFKLGTGTYTTKISVVSGTPTISVKAGNASTTYLVNNNQTVTFTVTNNDDIKITFTSQSFSGIIDYTIKLWINVGTIANNFEKYQGDTYNYLLPCAVYPNDEITNKLINNIMGYIVYDGSSDEQWGLNMVGTNTVRFSIPLPAALSGGKGLCNNNKWVTSGISSDKEVCGVNTGYFYYRLSNTKVSDLASFKTWLSNNNIKICYELNTPYTTNLTTPIDIKALQHDKYTPKMNILYTNIGDVSIGYNKDSNAVLEDLTNAILSQGGNV